jgi:hypothetical protein
MKLRIFIPVLSILFALSLPSFSQEGSKVTTYNTMSFFYVDNSEDSHAASLNSSMASELKEKVSDKQNNKTNYFYFFASDGSKSQRNLSYNPATLLQKALGEYLSRASQDADYDRDKEIVRTSFTEDFPVKIKQSVDVYIFLSSYAVKRMLKEAEQLPFPVTIPKEISLYLNSKDIKLNVYVYVNKEAATEYGINDIRNCFTFCDSKLNLQYIQFEFKAL